MIINQKNLNIDKHIISWCAISDYAAWKDDTLVFEHKELKLAQFLLSLYNYLNIRYPKFYKMDSLSKLGWLACEILLNDQPIIETLKAEEKGLVLSNTNSSLDTDLKYLETAYSTPSPALFVYTLPNIVMGEICISRNIKGEVAFFIDEHFDAEFMEQYVGALLDENMKMCICGWVDVMHEAYKAVLFLVSKNPEEQSLPFTKEHMNNLIIKPIKVSL